jgi:flagellar hook assembly protein FlgD
VPLQNRGAGAQRLDWDGVVGTSRVADGEYILALWATDAGAIFTAPSREPVTAWQLARYGITVDTTPPPVSRISANAAAISPNGDATAERVGVTMNSPAATQWGFRVAPVTGAGPAAPIREGVGTGSSSPISWTWDGRTGTGAVAPDGHYLVSLWASDAAGNRNTRSADVAVDTRAAAVTARASLAGFSPNGDGVHDTVALSWSADESTTGTVTVMRGSAIVRMWPADTTGTVVWDGRDAAGKLMPDAAYDFVVELVDAAGNQGSTQTRFAIDRTATRLAWSPSLFFPHDADALAPTAAFTFDLSRQATTSLRLYGLDGTPARTAWTDRTLAAGTHRFTWDGTSATGIRVPRGWYRAILTATSSLSTTRVSKLVLVDAYTVTLSNPEPAAGETLTVRIRTAEPLAAPPSVTFTQSGRSGVTRTASHAAGSVYVATFTVAAGAPGPATISITGRDTGGHTNSQLTRLTVR